jgi:perosamine synthetase
MSYRIPLYQPNISGNEKKYVDECLSSSWISSKGKFVNLFEQNFSSYIGCNYGIAVCNGTVSLHLALLGLEIGVGDEVIVPTFTYIASVNAIRYVGATPVFVDSLESTWQMDPADVQRKITAKTKAIMVVHLYGQSADMASLMDIAKKNKLYVVEDCAEAIGTEFDGKKVGSFGDVASYSFYGNKTITTGEGGMLVLNNEDLYHKMVKLKGQGLAGEKEYWHDVIGYNYRMTNICAAIGVAQLERVEDTIKRKVEIANLYKKGLEKSGVEFHTSSSASFHTYWMCSILVEKPEQRDLLRKYLAGCGIETRPLFYPIHTMPMYFESKVYEVAENLSSRGMNIPSYPDLSNEMIELVISSIIEGVQQLN